jgi:hypothetical protein
MDSGTVHVVKRVSRDENNEIPERPQTLKNFERLHFNRLENQKNTLLE